MLFSRKAERVCMPGAPASTTELLDMQLLYLVQGKYKCHPKGTVSKDRGRTQAPDAQHPQTLRGSPQTQHVHFQANLLIYLPKLSYIKYVTPEIKHTHYCDDSRFWDNNNVLGPLIPVRKQSNPAICITLCLHL